MRRKTAIVFVAFGVSDRVGTAAERRADATVKSSDRWAMPFVLVILEAARCD
jgi:hypothetical protein